MCDILRRLASPALTKQQYLSSLNEFSRLCRANRKEELFQIVGQSPANNAVDPGSIVPDLSTVQQINNYQKEDGDPSKKEEEEEGVDRRAVSGGEQIIDPNHSSALSLENLAIDATPCRNPIFTLNRADENDVLTMDDVFRW